ncbi:MAG TPA: response regulator [Verrucomicrobiae bacterium]|nr:response regulator [Verrucomicrobiae bacterium]
MAKTEKPKKILMVEDEASMREIVVHKLTTNGFEVKEAEDGKKGLDAFVKEKPDLILLDLMLPEMDGFEVLEKIRSNPDKKLADTPVIILSNLWSNEDIIRIKHLKVQAYMVKAYFTTEEILNKINEILSQSAPPPPAKEQTKEK